jgi:hypothetical protein
MTQFQQNRSTREAGQTITGRFKGGKLAPVMAVPFRESESGILNQEVTFELDPIAGKMITPVIAEVFAVYVPIQAIDALKNPNEAYAGNEEIIRQKLLSGAPLFDMEAESELSQRMGVVPRSIAGVKSVCEVTRLAHNCAVNYLRRRKYVNALQLLAANTAMTPALLSTTILERLNGVLDPEDRINGSVDLELGTVKAAVSGFGTNVTSGTAGPAAGMRETDGSTSTYANYYSTSAMVVEMDGSTPPIPQVFADLAGGSAGNISLSDFYNAERMDALVRQMRQMVDENPEYGEDMVARFAHGLSVEVGKQPFMLYESQTVYGAQQRYATDGASLDDSQSDLTNRVRFTVPVPKTELGGMVVTFAVLKPDETISAQPHPILSEAWGAINYIADEQKIDPVPVTIRDLDGDCAQVDEGTIVLYTGNNELKRRYVNYGFARNLDQTKVAAKTALWQYEIPASVTPEGVIYPDALSHYPFSDQTAEVCTYVVNSSARINTPIVYGPSPVETLAAITTSDIFEENP